MKTTATTTQTTGNDRQPQSVWETILRVVIAIASALVGMIGGQALG